MEEAERASKAISKVGFAGPRCQFRIRMPREVGREIWPWLPSQRQSVGFSFWGFFGKEGCCFSSTIVVRRG